MNTTSSSPAMAGPSLISANFSWYDYIIFVVMLAVSALIGIYFGCFAKKKATASEYLMGSKEMKVIPIAMSLIASHVSGITLLAVPSDVYRYGAGYWLSVISMVLMAIVTMYVYLPVFFNLQITSTYEYLQLRFDEKTRIFSSFLFTLSQFLYLPIVVYIPALAFSAATGINLHYITPMVCGICIFYTTIGGLKAVVWTDTLQFTVTLAAITTVLILGTNSAGGIREIWSRAVEGDRLNIFDFGLDFTQRDQFWALFIGYTIHWVASSNTNQGCVQKLLSVATLRDAKMVVILYGIGLAVVKSASVITGLIIYAKYADCDPFTTQQISKDDQLFPYYVLDVAGHIPGISGLFIAGVFSTALSTLSAHLNCLSGTIYEDFISRWMPKNIAEERKSDILKLIVVVCGVICTVMVFLFEHLGGILPLSIAFHGLTGGPMLGMFTLGVLFRKANSKGAFYGGITGIILLSGLVLPAQFFKSMKMLNYQRKPLSVDNCTYEFNLTTTTTTLFNETINGHEYYVPSIFRISHYYYTMIGCIFTLIAGLIISRFTDDDEKDGGELDENLFSPIIQKTNKKLNGQPAIQYNSIQNALYLVTKDSNNELPNK